VLSLTQQLGCRMQGYFGCSPGWEEPAPGKIAEAPKGSWIAQWQVGQCSRSWGVAISYIQGVLNDGTTLPPLAEGSPSDSTADSTANAADSACNSADVITTVEGKEGFFTTLHGR
jgi:hypothetical protein